MKDLSGRNSTRVISQTIVSLSDTPGHELHLLHSTGRQTSSDEQFNNAHHHAWGTSDLVKGSGHSHGYFVNEHPNGERDCGTFEGKMTTANGQVTMEGHWKYTHGTGKFNNISGGGQYTGRLTSPTEMEISWEGSYQLAAGTKAA
jgi:hypothetical protein